MKKLFLLSTLIVTFSLITFLDLTDKTSIYSNAFAAGCCDEECDSLCEDDDGDLRPDHHYVKGGGNMFESLSFH